MDQIKKIFKISKVVKLLKFDFIWSFQEILRFRDPMIRRVNEEF